MGTTLSNWADRFLAKVETVDDTIAAFSDEDRCPRVFEALIWPDGRVYPARVLIFGGQPKCHSLLFMEVCPPNLPSLRPGFRELLELERHRCIACGVRSFFEGKGGARPR